jgi:hypothetical protein
MWSSIVQKVDKIVNLETTAASLLPSRNVNPPPRRAPVCSLAPSKSRRRRGRPVGGGELRGRRWSPVELREGVVAAEAKWCVRWSPPSQALMTPIYYDLNFSYFKQDYDLPSWPHLLCLRFCFGPRKEYTEFYDLDLSCNPPRSGLGFVSATIYFLW